MIFLRISSHKETLIEQIAELLLKERMVIDVNIKRNIERLRLVDQELIREYNTLMTSKTKGLLFSQIDELIRDRFPNETMEIYSLPIIHMDWADAKHLKKGILEV